MKGVVSVYRGNELLFEKVKLAATFGAKFRGLMFYREMPKIDGLLLYPCYSAHMFWMRFSLDLIYLSLDGAVIMIETLAPNQLGGFVKNAYYLLETEAGSGAVKDIRVGDRFWWK
jgi:uncharacterized membrane protein (UPF0127 family)